MNKAFIITIDTEGDNLWGVSDINQRITTENARYLFRFQELCETFGFKPTYLTNYEMANEKAMIELGREGIKKATLEIGAHEHAWNQPPYYHLVKRPGKRGKPYLSEYPREIIRRKLEYLTHTLEDTYQCPIKSHRGGRWCLNSVIVNELERLGYKSDCTCTPGVNWKFDPGWTFMSKGSNWEPYSNELFYLNKSISGRSMTSKVLEVPVSVIDQKGNGHFSWMRPNLHNRNEMKALLKYISDSELEYAEFMLHSSELMPGGSPIFTNRGKIERLYQDINELFEYAKILGFVGITVTDFVENYERKTLKEL